MRILLALGLLLFLGACSDPAKDARLLMEEAQQKRKSDSLLTACRLADKAVGLDSSALNVFHRGIIYIEAGMMLDKNQYYKDSRSYLNKGIEDLVVTEGHKMHTSETYFYRGVARSIVLDKVGACSDLYYARRLGRRIPPRVWKHAECAQLDSVDVELDDDTYVPR